MAAVSRPACQAGGSRDSEPLAAGSASHTGILRRAAASGWMAQPAGVYRPGQVEKLTGEPADKPETAFELPRGVPAEIPAASPADTSAAMPAGQTRMTQQRMAAEQAWMAAEQAWMAQERMLAGQQTDRRRPCCRLALTLHPVRLQQTAWLRSRGRIALHPVIQCRIGCISSFHPWEPSIHGIQWERVRSTCLRDASIVSLQTNRFNHCFP